MGRDCPSGESLAPITAYWPRTAATGSPGVILPGRPRKPPALERIAAWRNSQRRTNAPLSFSTRAHSAGQARARCLAAGVLPQCDPRHTDAADSVLAYRL